MKYHVFLCSKCSGICAGRASATTFKCSYCGARNRTENAVRVASGVESRDVPPTIARLKMERAKKTPSPP